MPGVHIRFLSGAPGADGQPYGAISDLAGRFSVTSLPAGTYMAQARLRGFVYMPPKGGGPVHRVSLKAGQALTDIKIEMAQEANISGRVLDDNGDPVQAGVRAEAGTDRAMSFGGFSNTDERGEFHMSVAPGKYYVVANPGNRGMRQQPEIRTDGSVDATYGETYYPARPPRRRQCWWKPLPVLSLPVWTSTWRGSPAALASAAW